MNWYKLYLNTRNKSIVSSGANSELEVDIVDVLARDGGDGIRYGLCDIDNFINMVSVTPINNRIPSEIIRGLKLIFEQLGKHKQLYSDEESSPRSKGLFRFVNESNIIIIQTLTHAHTIERFIYTFRTNLQRILDALNQDKTSVLNMLNILLINIIIRNIAQFR